MPMPLPMAKAASTKVNQPMMAVLRCRALHIPTRAAKLRLGVSRCISTPPLRGSCDMAARSHRESPGSVVLAGVCACGPLTRRRADIRTSLPVGGSKSRDMDESEALRELVEEQAALRRVATLVAVEHNPERVFSA